MLSKYFGLSISLLIVTCCKSVFGKPAMGGYYETWSANCKWWPEVWCDLANVTSYFDQVYLSFASPSENYDATNANCLGTQFPTTDPKDIQLSLKYLRQNSPDVKVFLSVGGATYPFPKTRMSKDRIQGILNYVNQYELDGVDLDYENESGCRLQGTAPKCATDDVLTNLIQDFGEEIASFNAKRNKKILLTAAPFSVGAYYNGAYVKSKPRGSHNGMWVNPLKRAGHYLDIINIMSYDAGHYTFQDTRKSRSNDYNPIEAYQAYKSIFKGKINVGIEIPPEGWGGNVVQDTHIQQIAAAIEKDSGDGLFIWSLQKPSGGAMSASAISEMMCSELGLENCVGKPGQLPKKKKAVDNEFIQN